MNPIAEEILSYYGTSSDEEFIEHYGIKRRSGRYPYGSGDDPYQHEGRDFLGRVEDLRKQNFTYTDDTGKKWTGDMAIAKSMGLNSTQFRTEIGIAKDERRLLQYEKAKRLYEKEGKGYTEIARELGIKNESSVRSLLNSESALRMMKARETADFIKKQVDKNKMVDVTAGTELDLRVSKEKLNQALYLLEREGYNVVVGGIPQVTNPGQQTNQRVILAPDIPVKVNDKGKKVSSAIYDFDKIHSLNEDQFISRDGGKTFEKKFNYPASMDSKRLKIRYAEEGGIDMDGVVQLRRGVDDLSLGESRYSQVRILVDGTHYIKGMAVYADDSQFPKGVDVIFNTNKKQGTPMTSVLKEIKKDPDNPFGSLIKDADQGGQYWYTDKNGKKKLGLINKRADEGDWTEWKDALPAQFLSKQTQGLAKKQLDLAKTDKKAEYEEICALTNPTVKKHLLNKFADSCDSAAVHLQAAALPGQKYHVILPINTLKETEVYAPNYPNGSELALIRYPHGGTFEIPILRVNNKNKLARELLGTDVRDAVGINSKVAERLSGADFDGDTVMCIPTNDPNGRVKIKSTKPLKDLEGFDPKTDYGYADMKVSSDGSKHYYDVNGREYKIISKKGTQTEMGKISNLITDMTLANADPADLAKAVKHSMVVIDAEKHKLDYKRSEIENDIATLNAKYRKYIDENGVERVGRSASTIISRAKGEDTVDKRQGSPRVNLPDKEWYDPSRPEGALVYKPADDLYYPIRKYDKTTGLMTVSTTDRRKITYDPSNAVERDRYEPIKRVDPKTGAVTYTNKAGDISYKMNKRGQKSTRMAETDDAMTLVSQARHPMELLYADYANTMKALANQARKEVAATGKIKYDKEAKTVYSKEVSSLESKLNDALKNATKERAALRRANAEVSAKKAAYEAETGSQMDSGDVKKASQQALTRARQEVGSVTRRDRNIEISDREWEAIQKGAISETQLKKILNNTDIDVLRERATPRSTSQLSQTQINRIKALGASNYTLDEIARKLGISKSSVTKYLKGAN